MGFLKMSLGAVMAAKAEWSLSLYQKVFLVRTVGKVASGAPFLLEDLMYNFLFEIFLLMALITDFIAFCLQQVFRLGGMGIMTLNAFSPLQHGMNIRLVHPYFIFTVAGIADLISFFLKNQFRYQTVPEMAIFALLLFDRSMYILHCHIFVGKFLVAVEAVFAYKLLSRGWSTTECPFLLRSNISV